MKLNKIKVLLFFALFSTLIGFAFTNNTYAKAITGETWELKALAEGIYKCYYATANNGDYIVSSRINFGDMDNYNDIIAYTNWNFVPLINGGGKPLDTKFKINDAGLSCRQLFGGFGHSGGSQYFPSLLETEDNKEILNKMGYVKRTDAAGSCFKVKFDYMSVGGTYNSEKESNEVCSSDGTLNTISVNGSSDKESIINFRLKNRNSKLSVSTHSGSRSREYDLTDGSLTFQSLKTKISEFLLTDSFDLNLDHDSHYVGKRCQLVPVFGGELTACITPGSFMEQYPYSEGLNIEYVLGGGTADAMRSSGRGTAVFNAIKQMVMDGVNSYDDLKFNSTEKKALYEYYLSAYYEAVWILDWDKNENLTRAALTSAGYEFVEQQSNGTTRSIAVRATKNKTEKVHVLDSSGHFSDTLYTYKDIIKDYDNLPNKDIDELIQEIEDWKNVDESDGEIAGSSEACWNSGIEQVAWILCPTEATLKDFAKGIGRYIDEWLQVDSNLYGNGSAAQTAWGFVRTIANTLMIVFMGVIIFSQLTGYGIDNYGIKKLLPKFIVMALLINLSFIICQLAVDLSNMLGNSIQGLFYGIGNGLIEQEGGPNAALVLKSGFIEAATKAIYTLSAGTAGATTAIITFVSVAGSNTGTVLAVILILLMLITIVVAVLMFFVSLGARTVIIIMCMILAPLAMVCYILPNTKSIYKKWFDAFKAALIIYPICGFTIGASYILKAIVVTQEAPVPMLVVAGIAPYLPFFMIPTMLKGAISTLGVIGAALSNVGSTFKNNVNKVTGEASKGIRDMHAFKDAQAEVARRRQGNYAMRVKNRLDKKALKEDKNGNKIPLSAKDERRRAYAYQTLEKQNAEDAAALQSAITREYEKEENPIVKAQKALENELADYKNAKSDKEREEKKNRINALTNYMVANGGSHAVSSISEAINKAGLSAGDGAYQVLRDNMTANRDFGAAMKSKRGGSMYDTIQHLGNKNMAESMAKGSLSSAKDWVTQSDKEIDAATEEAARIRALGESATGEEKRALNNFEEIARQIVASDDPSIKTNVRGDNDKRAAWVRAAGSIPGFQVPSDWLGGQTSNNGTFNVGTAKVGDQYEVSINRENKPKLPKGTTEFRPHVEPQPEPKPKTPDSKPKNPPDPTTPFNTDYMY